MLTLAKITQPNFQKLAKATEVSQFITIPFSHYVEYARWCMQYKSINFIEYGYCPLQHVLPVLSIRVSGPDLHISDSSRMVKVLPDGTAEVLSERTKKKIGATAVPILVTPEGVVCRDSWEIVEYSFLGVTGISAELRHTLDEEIGPLSRQLIYSYLLAQRNHDLSEKMFLSGCGFLFIIIWKLFLGFLVRSNLRSSMRSEDPTAVAHCKTRLKRAFERVGVELQNKKTIFLGGDSPGPVDFAIAALSAPVVAPREYCLGRYVSIFDEIERTDPEYRREVEYWRNTIVGQHCLMMYRNYGSAVEEITK